MGLILRLQALELDWECVEAEALGLRQVEDVLVPLARADPPPRVVEQVLELWLQEVTVWTGAGPAACGSVFAERPALKDAVFDPGMRYSVRNAPFEALRAFRKAMGAMLEQVRAAPSCVAAVDALALRACKAAERVADEARELDAILRSHGSRRRGGWAPARHRHGGRTPGPGRGGGGVYSGRGTRGSRVGGQGRVGAARVARGLRLKMTSLRPRARSFLEVAAAGQRDTTRSLGIPTRSQAT